ncbi:hypothetical protein BKA56DRAFT_262817 [Ilyonectria sp. MPI-CAGE-AT-0026]|nr:hypothetical protein BKA56DRAFT_262817 [Ilyonectria sp. MPI-CAGE-AT-0026]
MLLAIGRSREDGALTCLSRVTGWGGKRVIRTEPPRHAVRKQRGDHSLEILSQKLLFGPTRRTPAEKQQSGDTDGAAGQWFGCERADSLQHLLPALRSVHRSSHRATSSSGARSG